MARDMTRDLAAAGGLVQRRVLLGLGHTPHAIRRALADHVLTVPRRGWLASAAAPASAVRAVVLGGVLGGASALESYGIWVDDPSPLVVSCAPTASRLPPLAPGESRVWLRIVHRQTGAKRWRVSVVDALLQLALVVDRDALIASVDSALNKKLLTARGFGELIDALPQRLRSIRHQVDPGAMSGTETRMRLALIRAGYRVETQVYVEGVGQVDILIDDWYILELDSKQFHDGTLQQTADRRRDGNSVIAGYGHDRFMWSQVRHDMDWCLAVVATRISDGRPERTALNRIGTRRAS